MDGGKLSEVNARTESTSLGTCTYRGSGMAPAVGLLGAKRVLQRLRSIRGQDEATETGRRATPQRIVDIVRNRTLK
jgi:hypothetical protein